MGFNFNGIPGAEVSITGGVGALGNYELSNSDLITLKSGAGDVINSPAGTYTKYFTWRINNFSSLQNYLRISCKAQASSGKTVRYKIYKNGEPVGLEHIFTYTATEYIDDLEFETGDTLEFWCYSPDGSTYCTFTNGWIKIYGDNEAQIGGAVLTEE